MMKSLLAALVLLSVLPLAVRADDLSYSYVEGAYTSASPQHGGSSLNGPAIDGSYAIAPNWHVFAGYQHVSCCSVSDNDLGAGVGWNTDLAQNVSLFVNGEFLSDNTSGNGSNTGWGATGGIRALLAPRFELDGFVTHSDVSSNTENTVGVKGLFSLDRYWWLYASYSNNSDFNTYRIGVRYVF